MATATRSVSAGEKLSFQRALDVLSREERFMATVSAMNTLMVQKGIYSAEEFEQLFCMWAENQLTRPAQERIGKRR